jgi:nitrite reductase/ring-hydroxylating ferredoxin subunit/uncharacterized membrane protein
MEKIVGRLERLSGLDRLGRKLSDLYAKVVRPGRLRDLLSGTPIRHPAHPLLTDVTIGAWTSAVLLDIFGAPRGAELLVGLGALSAAPTALTGLNDLTDITDNDTRSLATAHALANVTALCLFVASYFVRRADAYAAGVALSAVGLAVVTGAGFLGGHLAYRKGLGVDQTIFDRPITDWKPVLDDDALTADDPKRVRIDGSEVMLFRSDGKLIALANRCSHRGGPLYKGKVQDGCVTCPWHLSTFRLEDGEIVRGPATAPQPAFDARIQNGKIEIRSRANPS